MNEWMLSLLSPGQETEALCESCNARSAAYGLTLTASETAQLQRQQAEVLRRTGRIELGGGVTERLVLVFRDSPYVEQRRFAETLGELQELFYTFKGECRERLSDEELLTALRLIYDGPAGGSTDYLSGVPWETMVYIGRRGSLAGSGLLREEEEDE